MNDQLENLLYQSGLTAQGCWDELDDYAQQGIEKFAELIIEECCDKFVDMQHKFHPSICAYEIKKHFGVEE